MRKKMVMLSALLGLCLTAAFGMGAQAANETEPETEAVGTETLETNELGIVEAEQWSEEYPEIVESYLANKDNSEAYSYVEAHPEIATLYEGMGFSSDYNSARGHSYTLEDVQATTRPHALSNCLACKTADYVQLLNKYGVDFYSMSFEDAVAEMNEPVTCYDCHTNDPSAGAAPIRQPMIDAVGEDYDSISSSVLSCAQCHNEYYFEPENKAVTHPYTGIANATPDAILAYYNEMRSRCSIRSSRRSWRTEACTRRFPARTAIWRRRPRRTVPSTEATPGSARLPASPSWTIPAQPVIRTPRQLRRR